jgi:hypothetical protein
MHLHITQTADQFLIDETTRAHDSLPLVLTIVNHCDLESLLLAASAVRLLALHALYLA